MQEILKCKNVVKKYGSVRALDGVTFSVEKGSIVGLVGPNGAGKTTLLKVALGILRRDEGIVELMGRDPLRDARARDNVGAIFERPNLPSAIPISRVLEYTARIRNASKSEVKRVIKLAGLTGHEWKPFSSLSAGLKQRAAIAHALVGNPSFIVADEPTSNLDPVERVRILNLISELNKDYGITFLVSSHILPEIVKIANHITLMSRGRILKSGTPENVLGGLRVSRIRSSDPSKLSEILKKHGFDVVVEGVNILAYLKDIRSQGTLFDALSSAVEDGVVIYSVDFVEASIEMELRGESDES